MFVDIIFICYSMGASRFYKRNLSVVVGKRRTQFYTAAIQHEKLAS